MIDFEATNRAALDSLPDLLPELLPEGTIKGSEFVCGDLAGNPGQSLSVNLDSGKWADFATGDKGGDPISLWAAVLGVSQAAAAQSLNDRLMISPQGQCYGKIFTNHSKTNKQVETWKTIPADSPPKSITHPKHGKPSAIWEYKGQAGELLGYACRFDPVGEKKQVLPYTYGTETTTGEAGWKWKAFSEPRPLYGLNKLAQRSEAPILIVEGEKTAEAAQRLIPAVVAITWPGGCKAIAKADLTPLEGRRVAIWPDNDKPGREAAEAMAHAALVAGAGEFSIIEVPPDKTEGWDLADAVAEGWTTKQVSKWIKENRLTGTVATVATVAGVAVATNGKTEHTLEIEKEDEWPKPEPLTTHQESAQYPFHILPGTIGAAVREVIAFVQCPVELAACSALSAIATVGQGLVDVRRDEGLEGPTSLYVLAIADSGERKSTVDGHFTKPIRQWQADQKEVAKPKIQRHEAELAAWQAKRNGIVAAITAESKAGNDTSELEPNLIDLEKNKPTPPQVPVLLYGDATPEGLAFELVHKWPVGGVLSSEAGVVFGGHAMGKDSAMRNMSSLNSFWSGESIPVTRKGSPSFLLEGVRLSMGLAVQRETVRAFLDSSKGLARGIGFLARFLIAWPQSTQGQRLFKEQSKNRPALAAFHNRLLSLLNEPLSYDENGTLSPIMLELSPDAKGVWISFHDDVEVELLPGREMAETQDVASKAADNAVRLAALFHLFEKAPGGRIGVDHMRAGATLAGWHLYEARRFMGEIVLPIQKHHATKLDAWLLEYCKQNRVDKVSTRNAMRFGPNCTREKLVLDSALQELIEACRIRIVKDGKKKTIKINPSLLRSDNGFA